MKRRNFFMSGFASSLFLLRSTNSTVAASRLERYPYTINDLCLGNRDIADIKPNYIEEWDEFSLVWQLKANRLFAKIKTLDVPKNGHIVEFGSFSGESLKKFELLFGKNRCLGFDIFDVNEEDNRPSNLKILDVKTLEAKDLPPISLAWSNTSFWRRNPHSKLHCKKLIEENLVPGGYIIDDTSINLPKDLKYKNSELIYDNGAFSIFRKA